MKMSHLKSTTLALAAAVAFTGTTAMASGHSGGYGFVFGEVARTLDLGSSSAGASLGDRSSTTSRSSTTLSGQNSDCDCDRLSGRTTSSTLSTARSSGGRLSESLAESGASGRLGKSLEVGIGTQSN